MKQSFKDVLQVLKESFKKEAQSNPVVRKPEPMQYEIQKTTTGFEAWVQHWSTKDLETAKTLFNGEVTKHSGLSFRVVEISSGMVVVAPAGLSKGINSGNKWSSGGGVVFSAPW